MYPYHAYCVDEYLLTIVCALNHAHVSRHIKSYIIHPNEISTVTYLDL